VARFTLIKSVEKLLKFSRFLLIPVLSVNVRLTLQNMYETLSKNLAQVFSYRYRGNLRTIPHVKNNYLVAWGFKFRAGRVPPLPASSSVLASTLLYHVIIYSCKCSFVNKTCNCFRGKDLFLEFCKELSLSNANGEKSISENDCDDVQLCVFAP